MSDPAQFASFAIQMIRDDGVIIYLNGVEMLRNNMPTGSVIYSTRASTSGDPRKYIALTASTTALLPGQNVLAVEVHQNGAGSSDLAFDIEINGVRR